MKWLWDLCGELAVERNMRLSSCVCGWVQCLILVQYIKMPPKADMATGVGAEMKAALAKLEERIWELLETMPPMGKRFTATIRHVMEIEKNWVSWKRQSCPVFERTAKPVEAAPEPVEAPKPKPKPPAKRRFAIPGLKPEKPAPPPREVTVHLGNAELDRLWSLEGNSESLAAASRDHVHTPQLVTFFAPVVEEANPDNGYEEEYKHKHDKVRVRVWVKNSPRRFGDDQRCVPLYDLDRNPSFLPSAFFGCCSHMCDLPVQQTMLCCA